uniref:Uncharacterized protein n=1 Tax=Candidatus Methanogaster sp. ANME-2c ERB4 TaxID=2759911 RepID=A0A7G9YHK5_9EURY|nr:hypothetical protein MJFALNKJ_00022 [Methanosarcinales archaeon ANME-2c ERB4]
MNCGTMITIMFQLYLFSTPALVGKNNRCRVMKATELPCIRADLATSLPAESRDIAEHVLELAHTHGELIAQNHPACVVEDDCACKLHVPAKRLVEDG